MHFTILHMLSTSSLQAFSGAATTSPIGRTNAPNPARLVRAPGEASPQTGATPALPLPDMRPSLPPPRGSLLNLSV